MGLFKFIMGEEPSIFEKAAFLIKNGDDKGAYGEWLTEYMFGSARLKGYSKSLHNIYVPYKGKTSEIDVMLIHEKGIFVIESKNYSGWIFGSAEQQKWTQCINKNTKKQFYNPIKQNKTHISALSEYLKIDKEKIKSFIVFSERCELKKIPENTKEYVITKRDNLLKLIEKEIEEKENKFTKDEVDKIEEKLKPLTDVSEEEKKKHIENIKEKYQDK